MVIDPRRTDSDLNAIIPDNPNQSYDMKAVIRAIVDNGEFFEPHEYFATNILICFARLNGRTIGIIANQPSVKAGCLDVDSADKATRFIRFCDAFNIPIITLLDSPAYMIGEEMERGGMIYKGAKLLHAYAEATVPLITVIVRKAYAGAYIAMGSQYIGADLVYAWPGAEISSVASKTAASIIFRKEIAEAENKEKVEGLLQYYHDNYVNPIRAASLRHINDIIRPSETRPILIKSLELIKTKKKTIPPKKHGNIPL